MPKAHYRMMAFFSLMALALTVMLWHIMAPGISFTSDGLIVTNGQDFLNYWGAPQIAHENINTLFAGRGYERALHQIYDQEFAQLRWSYPLHSLFFFAPFAAFSYITALLLWTLLGLGFYAVMLWYCLPRASRTYLTLWLFVSPIVMVELLTRQNGFFIGAAALAVLLLLEKKRAVSAGILLGCLTIKPQLFILWPLMLLVERQWRCIFAAILTTVILIGFSLVVHGLDAWQQWWAVVPDLQWHIISAEQFNESRKLTHLMMPGVMPSLCILGAPELIVQGVQWLVSIGVLVGVACALRRPRRFAQTALLLGSGGLLVTPYGFNYDMTFFCAGILLWWATRPRMTLYETLLLGIAYMLPLLVYVFNVTDAPVAPIILVLVFYMILREILRQPAHP